MPSSPPSVLKRRRQLAKSTTALNKRTAEISTSTTNGEDELDATSTSTLRRENLFVPQLSFISRSISSSTSTSPAPTEEDETGATAAIPPTPPPEPPSCDDDAATADTRAQCTNAATDVKLKRCAELRRRVHAQYVQSIQTTHFSADRNLAALVQLRNCVDSDVTESDESNEEEGEGDNVEAVRVALRHRADNVIALRKEAQCDDVVENAGLLALLLLEQVLPTAAENTSDRRDEEERSSGTSVPSIHVPGWSIVSIVDRRHLIHHDMRAMEFVEADDATESKPDHELLHEQMDNEEKKRRLVVDASRKKRTATLTSANLVYSDYVQSVSSSSKRKSYKLQVFPPPDNRLPYGYLRRNFRIKTIQEEENDDDDEGDEVL